MGIYVRNYEELSAETGQTPKAELIGQIAAIFEALNQSQ